MSKSHNPSVEDILKEMEAILSELVSLAKKLKETSQHNISKEEITPLQSRQEELIQQLCVADAKYCKLPKGEINGYASHTKTRVGEMLDYFQKLNAHFIENVKSSQSLIEFEKRKQ